MRLISMGHFLLVVH